jgi:hypothetical protein
MATITLTADAKTWREWAIQIINVWAKEPGMDDDSIKMWRDLLCKAETEQAIMLVCREMLLAWNPFDILSLN